MKNLSHITFPTARISLKKKNIMRPAVQFNLQNKFNTKLSQHAK